MENLTKQKIFLIIVYSFVAVYYYTFWAGCHLANTFYFSKSDLILKIIFDIHSDQNIPQFLARLLHNKVTQGGSDIINAYLAFWNLQFLLLIYNPFALFGFFTRFYYLIQEKMTWKNPDLTAFILLLLIPILIVTHIIYKDAFLLLLFILPLSFLSLKGWFMILKKHRHAQWYIVAFILFTLWFSISIESNLTLFCVR